MRMHDRWYAIWLQDRCDRLTSSGKYTRKRTSSITEIPPGTQNSLERDRIELSSDESVSVSDISNSDTTLPYGDIPSHFDTTLPRCDIPSRGISSQDICDTSSHVISDDDIDGW